MNLVPTLHVDGMDTSLSCGPTGTGCVVLHVGGDHFCFDPSTAQWLARNLLAAASDEMDNVIDETKPRDNETANQWAERMAALYGTHTGTSVPSDSDDQKKVGS